MAAKRVIRVVTKADKSAAAKRVLAQTPRSIHLSPGQAKAIVQTAGRSATKRAAKG